MLQFLDKVEPVTKTNWLSSGIINRAMENLIQQHPEIGGLYCSTLGGTLEYPQATGERWFQIVHNGKNHWLFVAKGFPFSDHILVYDSGSGDSACPHVLSCMSSLIQTSNREDVISNGMAMIAGSSP
jgi:hypothetical protein